MREVRYDPFTYVWDLVEARYPEPVAQAGKCRPREAARQLAQRYLTNIFYATRTQLLSVIGDRALAEWAVADLHRAGTIDADCTVDNLPGAVAGALARGA